MTSKPGKYVYSAKRLEIKEWYFARLKDRDRKPILTELQRRFENETDSQAGRLMYTLLKSEHALNFDPQSALSLAEQEVREFPDDPLSLISLAEDYALQTDQAALALETIDTAIRKARQAGKFRRQALQTKARFYRWFKRFPELEKCLIEIMREPHSTGIEIAKEDDFMGSLPPDAISPEVERAYREFMTSP